VGAVIAREKCVLVDSLQKQEDRDARGRFLKGRSGNPEGRFRKGRSGNPKGRPAGARNKATQSAELLLDGEAEALTRRAVELALAGDGMALRLCLERIIPPIDAGQRTDIRPRCATHSSRVIASDSEASSGR
jgi:hypothetical protein